MAAGPSISVVIPALNEREHIERALSSTRLPDVERVVVDGGSRDGTPETARVLEAEQVVASAPGRAAQMDLGYRLSSGDVVIFLHADSRLEQGWLEALRRALDDEDVAGGAFRLRFDSESWRFRSIELGVRLRSWLLRLPYGDQALFARRRVLDERGGVPAVPIFEDLDLARDIRRAGKLALLRPFAHTSPRRYERHGALRVVILNLVTLGAYLLDLDRVRVCRWYRRCFRG